MPGQHSGRWSQRVPRRHRDRDTYLHPNPLTLVTRTLQHPKRSPGHSGWQHSLPVLFTFLRRPVKRVQWPAPVLWRWMGGLLQGLCRPWPQRDLVSEQQNPQKPQQETQKPTFRWGGLCLPGGVASVRWDGPCFQVGWPCLSVRWGGSSQSGGVACLSGGVASSDYKHS